jgi:hypothetical protein
MLFSPLFVRAPHPLPLATKAAEKPPHSKARRAELDARRWSAGISPAGGEARLDAKRAGHEWARANGRKPQDGILAVPDMAPGQYQFCADARCVEGVLAVRGRLELNAGIE